ncbi:MAG: 30S ribosomal protein S6 [Treponema sp.]|nr:30S ribosomal protein S6 [Treponema sp.]
MRQYELTVVYPTEEELFRLGKETVGAELAKQGAAELKEEDKGDRPLAYPIKKRDRGHYVLYTMNFDPQKVDAAEKAFKLNQHILKYLFIRAEA